MSMAAEGLQVSLPVALVERLVGVLERMEGGRQPDDLLSTEETAKRLGKSTRDVQRLVKKGLLKKVPGLGARTTRFRPQDVAALVAGGRDQIPGRRRL